ncbi:mitochondrial import receptor subunit TOM40-like [Sigmodon hispidus]
MGNVLAASSPPAGPPPPPTPSLVGLPPPPPSPPGFTLPPLGGGLGTGSSPGRGSERTPGAAGSAAAGASDDGGCGCLPNPGTFEECHRKCKELFPVQMEGVKLTVNKGLSNRFQVTHTVALGTIGESNYHFGVTYVGTKQLSPTEAFPVLVGDMDNSGSLNAQVIHQLSPGLRSKMAIQTQQSKQPRCLGGFRNPRGPLSPEHHAVSGPGRRTGLPPPTWRRRHCHVPSWEIHIEQLVGNPAAGPAQGQLPLQRHMHRDMYSKSTAAVSTYAGIFTDQILTLLKGE